MLQLALALAVGAVGPSVEIAPGVSMPMASLGGVLSRPSNYSAWLSPAVGGHGVDTALSYGTATQSATGAAARAARAAGGTVFLTTKIPCCPDGVPQHTQFSCDDPGAGNASHALERDLLELGVDTVDLVLLHWPCTNMAQSFVAYRALEDFKLAGKARAIGVSNFNASQLAALLAVARVPPAVNQCEFAIGDHDDATLAFCRAHNITYEAYSPLGGLSGIDVLHDPDVLAIAAAHGVAAAQVALRWVVQQGVPFVTAAMNPVYMREDLDLFGFALSDAEMTTLSNK